MMVVQASGSSLVGQLADAGYAYDAIFDGLILLPLCALIGLTALSAADRLPDAARA